MKTYNSALPLLQGKVLMVLKSAQGRKCAICGRNREPDLLQFTESTSPYFYYWY